MRNEAWLFTMLFITCFSCGQATNANSRAPRLSIASSWLDDLCAVPPGAFLAETNSELSSAFDDWLSGKTDTSSCHVPARNDKSEENIDFSKVKLIPSALDRLLRMPEFQADGQQTPDYVYGVLENAPVGTPSTFLTNTDHGIFSYGGPIHFDELFVSSEQRVALCSALGADKQKAGPDKEQKYWTSIDRAIGRAHCNDEPYMATSRYRDSFARIGSAITLNIRFSQVPLFESGVLISPNSPNLQKWSATLTGGFDTSKLFRSLAETSSLATYVLANKKLKASMTRNKNFDIPAVCNLNRKELANPNNASKCIGTFEMGGKLERVILFALPNIAVKVTSPFDLAKYGSTFEEPPNHAGRSLYDVTLTWNLHNQVPNAATLAAGIKAVNALYKSPGPPDDADWRRQVKMLYIELKNTPPEEISDELWNKLRITMLNENKKPLPAAEEITKPR